MQARLLALWMSRSWLARLLLPLAWFMGIVVRLRQGLYMSGLLSSYAMPVPVVVVGNVVAGGAGKTPTVIATVAHLQSRGWQPGVISRGHGRKANQACTEVMPDSDVNFVGDEPLLIRRRTGVPVVVARSRVAAARALLAAHPQVNVLVCDDGLQHLALKRDIDIAVFDNRGVGNGWLLPAGPLREPWPRAVDLVLHTGSEPAFGGTNCYHGLRQLAPQAVQADGTRCTLRSLPSPVLAVAGIAQPQAFFDMLRAQGVAPAKTLALPDHHDFANFDPQTWQGYTVVCTEKDAVKLQRLLPQAWAVPLIFSPPPAFFSALDRALEQAVDPALDDPHAH